MGKPEIARGSDICPAVTRAADGFSRRAFTVSDIFKMIEVGIIGERENFELIEGEIVPMSPKKNFHEFMKSALTIAIARALPEDLWLGVESSIYLSEATFVEPDVCIYRRGMNVEDVKGPDILLAIEVAATSLNYDKRLKAALYAEYGMREYWLVDAERRVTWVHTDPKADGSWGSIVDRGPALTLATAVLPDLRVTLGNLK
jgi:Uma2 family endonuclease